MATMTNGRMAHLLSVKTHRGEYPVVRWIEENIANGKAAPDYGTSAKEVIQEVSVRFVESFEYEIIDGKVTRVIAGWNADRFFDDPTKPTRKEIDLIEVCDYTLYKMLKNMCHEILAAFRHPHSCSLDYYIMEATCSGSGCEKIGPVNYFGVSEYQYYCGGSPRCCP